MTDITMIALSKLVPGQRNVRKTKPAMSIDELAASIAAHGLLQNLIVSEADKGRYSVEAGGRPADDPMGQGGLAGECPPGIPEAADGPQGLAEP